MHTGYLLFLLAHKINYALHASEVHTKLPPLTPMKRRSFLLLHITCINNLSFLSFLITPNHVWLNSLPSLIYILMYAY